MRHNPEFSCLRSLNRSSKCVVGRRQMSSFFPVLQDHLSPPSNRCPVSKSLQLSRSVWEQNRKSAVCRFNLVSTFQDFSRASTGQKTASVCTFHFLIMVTTGPKEKTHSLRPNLYWLPISITTFQIFAVSGF